MIGDGTYEELECALSHDRHFVKGPIILTSCGHATCKECIPQNRSDKLLCNICGKETNRDISNDCISISTKRLLNANIENLFKILEVQASHSLNGLKCK